MAETGETPSDIKPVKRRGWPLAAAAKGGRKRQGTKRPHAATHTKIARTQANARKICEMIVAGLNLTEIAHKMGASGHSTILMWVAQDPEFDAMYRAAKVAQADHYAEEVVAIADDGSNDWMERQGIKRVDYEAVGRSKLRVETRLRLMGQLAPKRYGPKLEVEHGVNDSFADALIAARERRMALISPPTIDGEICSISVNNEHADPIKS